MYIYKYTHRFVARLLLVLSADVSSSATIRQIHDANFIVVVIINQSRRGSFLSMC